MSCNDNDHDYHHDHHYDYDHDHHYYYFASVKGLQLTWTLLGNIIYYVLALLIYSQVIRNKQYLFTLLHTSDHRLAIHNII